jgi:hypothetical protein
LAQKRGTGEWRNATVGMRDVNSHKLRF